MKTTIILLRGVMPTGKNKVLMAPLRTALEEVGLSQVRTYIQSGNVIVSTRLGLPAVERLVHETIKEQLGAELKVLARHVPYFEEVLARNPFRTRIRPSCISRCWRPCPKRRRWPRSRRWIMRRIRCGWWATWPMCVATPSTAT